MSFDLELTGVRTYTTLPVPLPETGWTQDGRYQVNLGGLPDFEGFGFRVLRSSDLTNRITVHAGTISAGGTGSFMEPGPSGQRAFYSVELVVP